MAAPKKKKTSKAKSEKKAKPVVKKRAPVSNTGGKGFSFEDAVAVRFMLDMLGQTNVLGVKDFGLVVRLDWQARDTGWLLDDLLITSFDGRRKRVAGTSIKSGQAVTSQGFPVEFVRLAWSQALKLGTALEFIGTGHVALFVTGQGVAAVKKPWGALLEQATKASPERLLARVQAATEEGAQFSVEARAIFKSLDCPTDLGQAVLETATPIVLSHVRWLDFDYARPSSQDYGADIALAKSLLAPSDASRAADLLEALDTIAAGYRISGGTLELPTLLTALAGKFNFREHADYAGDWQALNARSDAELSIIKTDVGGLPSLDRSASLAEISSVIAKQPICFLVGESGSGKTAISKQFAANYANVIWLNGSLLDHASLPDFLSSAGIKHPIAEIVGSAVPITLIVVDAIEGFSANAKKVLAQLILSIQKSPAASRAHFLMTTQLESAVGVTGDLTSLGIGAESLKPTVLKKPSVKDVAKLVSALPNVGWVALNLELRTILTNLKILDWFVRFSQSGGQLASSTVGLTNLIDALWAHWVARGADGPSRADLLKQVGAVEADEHLVAVPTSKLGHAEQVTLGKLPDAEFLRVREERVTFSHDLLGDWARLRVLIGEDWILNEAKRERFTMPKWARAVRLYAQRLLEQSDSATWQQQLGQVGDTTTTGKLVRDLFLEALFFAPNATALLRQAWPVLIADKAALLGVLLKRFLYVATLPHPRLAMMLEAGDDPTRFEHLMRFPYWPLWGPVFTVLLENINDTAALVPHEAAKLCALWLRTMNFDIGEGKVIRWRTEAATIALAVARKIQVNDAAREPYSAAGSKEIFEALLLAGAELPVEVGQLSLELCHRREVGEDAKRQILDILTKRDEAKAKEPVEKPKRKRPPPPSIISFRGELREPWPDGPPEPVDHYFIEAAMEFAAFAALAKTNPDAAYEVLLACCIEHPQYDEYGTSRHEQTGLNHWQGGSSPMWYRGPFYQFFNLAPSHALAFVIKLINFVSERNDDGRHAILKIDGADVKWLGDSNSFTWHYDGHLWNGEIAQCSLMALEKWLYDQLDAGKDIETTLRRIMAESRSIAFAGLLITVGKRKPELFLGVLAPLLTFWRFLDWDFQLCNQRTQGGRGFYAGWGLKSKPEITAAQQWASLPHRQAFLLHQLAGELLPLEENIAFFHSLVTDWSKDLDAERNPVQLRRIVETLTRENYEFSTVDGRVKPIKFKQAPEDKAQDAILRADATKNLTALTLPFQCRKLLNERRAISSADLQPFFDLVKSQYDQRAAVDDVRTTADIVLGGVAVLVCLGWEWLQANPTVLAWCRDRLTEYVGTPPTPQPFYSDNNLANDKADSFAAEAGVALLSQDDNDLLARRLVAGAISGHYLSTTQLTLVRIADHIGLLAKEFRRAIALGLECAAIRPCLHMFGPDETADATPWITRRQELIASFVDSTLPAQIPNIVALNAQARSDLDAIHAMKHPEHAKFLEARQQQRVEKGENLKLSPKRIGFDGRMVQACLSWLTPNSSGALSRKEVIEIVHQMMGLVLDGVPKIKSGDKSEIDGLPSDFDGAVFEKVAQTIQALSVAEKPESLWKPLLSLGPPGHQWIEQFYWQWFTTGFDSGADRFFAEWRSMVEFAVADPAWDPKANWHHRIDDAIYQLLGFNARFDRWMHADIAPQRIASMESLFERAARRWFKLPKILTGWLEFAQHKSVGSLAIKSLPWIDEATKGYDDWEWRHGTDNALINFLSTCWQNSRDVIVADEKLRNCFLSMVKMLAARGSHPALALQQRVTG